MLQSTNGWCSFYVLHSRLKKARAAIHFHISQGVARSPLKSPFGSIEFSDTLPARVLFDFISYLEEKLRREKIQTIIIKNYPHIYHTSQASMLTTFLLNQNYKASAEVGSFLDVTSSPVETGFNYSVRYKFQQARKAGVAFAQIPPSDARNVYEFIEKCQSQRGYSLSMTYDHLEKSLTAFRERYLFFGLFLEEKLIAASITVRVNERILYDYAHAHDRAFDNISPVISLIHGIYGYCHTNKIDMLDLGTSALEGMPDFDLLYFKRSLGTRTTLKLTFEKGL